jgi:hypothetical protein
MNGFHHPPFAEMWAALPLLFQNPTIPKQHLAWIEQRWNPLAQYQFADTFLYKNTVSADRLMSNGRWMQVLLSLLLGLAVAFVGWRVGGFWCSFFSMAFWAFSPTILANATVVSTDLAFTLFFFLFFASLLSFGSKTSAVVSGVLFGLALVSKYFSISVFPILVGTIFLTWASDEKATLRLLKEKVSFVSVLLFLAGVVAVVLLVFQFSSLNVFFVGIKNIFARSQAGRSSFFMGKHGHTGWVLYFPTLVLMKTPISLLLSVGGFLVLGLMKKIRFPFLLWVPPLLFFVLACTSKVQIGQRYVMVIYPFLFLMAGAALSWNNVGRWIGLVMIGLLTVTTVRSYPYYLAYFNEAVGGSAQGYRYFTDSNIDWGQGLKELAMSLEPSDLEKGIYLSYFGVADPHHYGISYFDVGSDTIADHHDDSSRKDLSPTKFAISVTNLQATYYGNSTVFDWLRGFTPTKKIADSIFVYDFSEHPEAIARLEALRG